MAPDPIIDEELVLRAQLGDRAALSELVHRKHDQVWSFVYQLTLDRSQADELTQETWLRTLRGLGGLRTPESFTPWLFTIARRTTNDRLRGKYRRDAVIDERFHDADLAELPATAESDVGHLDRLELVAAIRHLDDRLREVIWLHYYVGFPVDAIGQILDVPPGTVKSRLHRARRELTRTTPDPRAQGPPP